MRAKIRIAVTVISDLVTDQRVHKVCNSLHKAGYEVVLIGAQRKRSLKLQQRVYHTHRIKLFFQKKFGFYAEFNLRLFLKLLFVPCDMILGNDLDVMPATFLAGRLRGKPVVYDTHEYYLGMPELNGKPVIKKVWAAIEKMIFPRLNYIYTICQSFCELYFKDYGKQLWYVRNVPPLASEISDLYAEQIAGIVNQLPKGKELLLFQGAGINPDRGVEELVLSMQHLDAQRFHLLIVGGGDLFERIIAMVDAHQLHNCITIIPKVPFPVLRYITQQATLGFTLDKPNNINHLYGLPNKIFDYLHAGVPVLSSRLPELEWIISEYKVGTFIDNHEPAHIAKKINEALSDKQQLLDWKKNTVNVKTAFNWENEEKTLLKIFNQVCIDNKLLHAK